MLCEIKAVIGYPIRIEEVIRQITMKSALNEKI